MSNQWSSLDNIHEILNKNKLSGLGKVSGS